MSTYSTKGMIPSLLANMATDGLLVFGILFASLRSIRLGIVTILPNIFPLVAAAAGLVLCGIPLRYSYVMCFSICLGIAVDDTIHVLFTYGRERRCGFEPRIAILRTMRRTIPAISTTAVLIIVGFAVAMFSSMPTVRLFGALTCAILLLALATEILLTPVLICAADRRRDMPSHPEIRADGHGSRFIYSSS
jgi:predicted RND superfamily exporter protein